MICDMAETYRVLNWRELPLKTAAALASGLPQDSRCRRKLSGQKLSSTEYIGFAILDELRLMCWMQTEDAKKGRNRPESILKQMMNPDSKNKVIGFRNAEEFEARRNKIIKGE